MANILTGDGPVRKRAGVKKVNRHNLRIDMTPMVDLGFLLITFFVITAELARPGAMDLFMPKDGPPMPVGESTALTIIARDDNAVYYYEGNWKDAAANQAIHELSPGRQLTLRDVILKKQHLLMNDPDNEEGRDALMVIIKPGAGMTYKSLVNMLDEMNISGVTKHAIARQTEEEKKWMARSEQIAVD